MKENKHMLIVGMTTRLPGSRYTLISLEKEESLLMRNYI